MTPKKKTKKKKVKPEDLLAQVKTTRVWEWADPLESIPGETVKSNIALRDYALMGAGRSYNALIDRYKEVNRIYTESIPKERKKLGLTKPPTIHIGTIKSWGAKFDWQSRVARWDVINSEGMREVYLERQLQAREKDWTIGNQLRDKVIELLVLVDNFKTTETTETIDPDTDEKIRVITMKLNTNIQQLSRAAKLASDLIRMSVDLPTERVELAGSALDDQIEKEMAELAELNQQAVEAVQDKNKPEKKVKPKKEK